MNGVYPMTLVAALLLACSTSSETGQDGGPQGEGGYHPSIDPASFANAIDNPFLPMTPGSVMTYAETDESDTFDITVTVTSETKLIMGVSCVVVHDVVTEAGAGGAGAVVEDTWDWYAQDTGGNVWYFGEDTTAYDGSTPSHAGSWEAGVDGALPGIVMPANPQPGAPYRQEYYRGQAEDMGQVLALDQSVTVPAGSYTGCVKTKDWSALEPGIIENKWFCPGVGNVRALVVEGGTDEEVLAAATIP
ncbi:MAG: hypothetical protein HY744_02705 [Deltaproteobacteria bacterium]|nr:hypothetical protein [Deltaproteobacteria bacterium]